MLKHKKREVYEMACLVHEHLFCVHINFTVQIKIKYKSCFIEPA